MSVFIKEKKYRCVRKATVLDPKVLAPKLRESDVSEVWASHKATPLEALTFPFSIKGHMTFSIIGNEDQGVIGMFGVVPTDNKGWGIAWLLTSDELYEHRKQFLDECPKWVEEMETNYSYLYNHVHTSNKQSMAWMRALGFKTIHAYAYGELGHTFALMCKAKEYTVKKFNRYSKAPKVGKDIYCPHCNFRNTVYHLSWVALECQHCQDMVGKKFWTYREPAMSNKKIKKYLLDIR
jgi:hypothetical protein